MPKRRTTYVVTDATIKAVARDYFLRGFSCSGFGAHGESRLRDSKAFESLLATEFERVWYEQHTVIAPRPPRTPR